MFTTYLLQSEKNGKSYIGVTEKDPKTRLAEHNGGSNEWTKLNRPFKLTYYETYHCSLDAYSRERFLKSGVGNRLVQLLLKEYGT